MKKVESGLDDKLDKSKLKQKLKKKIEGRKKRINYTYILYIMYYIVHVQIHAL